MDKREALSIARQVRAQNRRDRKERDAFIQELIGAVCEELKVQAEDVEVTLLGTGGAGHVIHVWDQTEHVARAYRFPLV